MAEDWTHHEAALTDLKMHYVRQGTGMPLILIHGWPEFWYTWHKNIPALSPNFDVIAPDLRGFGDSGKPATPPTLETYIDDIIELADVLGLGRFGLVGHDVGAFILQNVGRRVPERVIGLFFFNFPHPGIGHRWIENGHYQELWYQTFHQQDWAADLVGQNRESCRLYLRHFLRHWSHRDDAFDDDLERWVDNFMKPGNLQGGFNWYRAMDAFRRAVIVEGPPDLPIIEPPSHVLWGSKDTVLLADWADNLDDYFREVKIEVAESAGHFVHYERPDLANDRITAFFRERSA